MEKSEKITLFSSILLISFIFAIFYHYIIGSYFGLKGIDESFLFPASSAFCDIFAFFPYIKDFAPYNNITLWSAYFPLAYILIYPLMFIKSQIVTYLIYITPFLIYLIVMNTKELTCKNLSKLQNIQNVFIITVLFYPTLYILDKGNLDMYLFILLGLCVYAFKSKKYLTVSILLGIINAIKPFTILFLLLFLKQKKYKEVFISLFITATLVIGGFLIFHDSFSNQIINFLKIQKLFRTNYATLPVFGFGFCSSLFMPLKAFMLHFSREAVPIANFVKLYDCMSFIAIVTTAFFVWREKTYWKQLTLIICNFILLPYCTYDYKLLFLLLPVWLFFNEENKSKFDVFYIVLFALLFIPKNLTIFLEASDWISLSTAINPIIMVILSLLIIYEQYSVKKNIEERIK